MSRPDNFWIQLCAGIVLGVLGIVTILTKHIGSWSIREQQANGLTAQFIGVLLIIMSVMTLADWIRKFRSNRRQ
jgi:uncharacterized membrane protein HdeD (DUF308 family)